MMNNDQRSHFFLPTVNYTIFRICNSYRVWSSSSLSQIKVNPWRLAAAQEELLQNSIKRQKAWRVVFFFATSQTWQWKDELIVFLVREREKTCRRRRSVDSMPMTWESDWSVLMNFFLKKTSELKRHFGEDWHSLWGSLIWLLMSRRKE